MALVKIKQIAGGKDVTTAGTRVALAASTILARNIVIQAKSTNTGAIFIGDSTVSSSDYGVRLTAGNSFSIELPVMGPAGADDIDLSEIYIDSSVNGEGVTVTYYVRNS